MPINPETNEAVSPRGEAYAVKGIEVGGMALFGVDIYDGAVRVDLSTRFSENGLVQRSPANHDPRVGGQPLYLRPEPRQASSG